MWIPVEKNIRLIINAIGPYEALPAKLSLPYLRSGKVIVPVFI